MWHKNNIILKVLGGSHAYGTSTPESDTDYKGIGYLPKEDYFKCYSLQHPMIEEYIEEASKGYTENGLPVDVTIYTLQKFFNLCSTCNPNIIEMLFNSEKNIVFLDDNGTYLLEHRKTFLSKRVRYSFAGYADAQLRRIQNHRQWLLNPPKKRPERKDYGLSPVPIMDKDQREAFKKLIQYTLETKREYFDAHTEFQRLYDIIDWGQCVTEFDEQSYSHVQKIMNVDSNFMEMIKREYSYKKANTHYNQYLNWKESRNEKRAELERKFGYDTKHATHLVRLLVQCKEILSTGDLHTDRTGIDSDFLKDIRNGKYKYEELIEISEKLRFDMDVLYGKCDFLPKEPDIGKITIIYNTLIFSLYGIEIDS